MLGRRAKKNRIVKYINEFKEQYEILDDLLDQEEPEIKIQTTNRIILIKCDEKGNVLEDYKMRRGCGSKSDYLKSLENHSEESTVEYKQLSIFDISDSKEKMQDGTWKEGTVVKNKYNDKEYIVQAVDGNVVEVSDAAHGYLIMARSDLKVVG